MTILITGAQGVIGRALRQGLKDFDLKLLDKASGEDIIKADICDFNDLAQHFRKIETVIHLAANKDRIAPWSEVVQPNVIGTANVYEAARQNGVSRVVFASSLNVYPWERLFKERKKITLATPATPNPPGNYGRTKIIGEEIGRIYHTLYGIHVVNLRLGSVNENNLPNDYAEGKAQDIDYSHWLSKEDAIKLFRSAVSYNGFVSVPCCSANKNSLVDISCLEKTLGVVPKDSSEKFKQT